MYVKCQHDNGVTNNLKTFRDEQSEYVANKFYLVGFRDELAIVYSGTGLSIQTLHWAMSGSNDIKEYGSNAFLYIEFPGWTGAELVLPYIDRLKDQLSDDESKTQVNTIMPPAAVEMLHKRSTGGFRPIVTAIEAIPEMGKWDTAINKIESMITSWKDRGRRVWNTRSTNILALHLVLLDQGDARALPLRHHVLDAPSTVLENDAQLVDAAFGRIKLFGGTARTVLDEPLALKATINYFWERDPSLVATAERAMLHSDNPSVHGIMWQAMMPPRLCRDVQESTIVVLAFVDQHLSSRLAHWGYDNC
ncbi:hypothetical protein BGX30_006395 [Mortierella sp. GBA39]|nr:hypothetical protein BGX30_006395 [Mortierella sp. GBA39]